MEYSKALSLHYEYFPNLNLIRFEDGVCYTIEETIIVSKMKNDSDVRAMHMVKKMFGGKILRDNAEKEEAHISWFEETAPVTDPDPSPVCTGRPVCRPMCQPDAEILTLDL